MIAEVLPNPLPAGWWATTLGEACALGGGEIQTGPFGSQLHASYYVPVGIPSIMPQNIGDNRVLPDGIARITPEDADCLSRYRVKAGDMVYSRCGDKGAGKYKDVPGFCKSATTDEIPSHGCVLTPVRYVGAEEVEDDDEPFEEKMKRLTAKLEEQFAESASIEKAIRQNLRGLGYGL